MRNRSGMHGWRYWFALAIATALALVTTYLIDYRPLHTGSGTAGMLIGALSGVSYGLLGLCAGQEWQWAHNRRQRDDER